MERERGALDERRRCGVDRNKYNSEESRVTVKNASFEEFAMNNREDDRAGKLVGRPLTYSAASASGASHERGHTLLPMLVGGLILILLGMIGVVLLV